MNKQKRVITGVIVVAILLMAIGYAGFSVQELTITGTASATASQDNFQVYFSGVNTKVETNGTVEIIGAEEGDHEAEVNVSKLSKAGDTAYAILQIINNSNDVDATSVKVTAQGTDSDFFDIAAVMCKEDGSTDGITEENPVISGGITYVKVSATLKTTPTANVDTDINVTIEATPESNVETQP